jgi:TRAP-type C4-dicarboxylate transport system substrate-binding protein
MLQSRFVLKGKWSLSCLFALLGLFLVASISQAKSYNITFQMAWHTQHPEYKAYQKFIDMVKEETNGQVTFTVFPASQLVSRSESLSALKMGTINMLGSCGAYYHGMVPEGDVDWLPYVSSKDRAGFWHLINDDTEFGNIVREAYAKKANAKLLTTIICGREVIIGRGNDEYDALSDLKNKKVRGAGGVGTRIVKALGASPVTIATGEIYPAVQRGTVDALIFPDYGLKDYKLYEVAKTFTEPPVYNWNDDLWINKDFFQRLPEDIQDTLSRVAYEWGKWASLEYWPQYMEETNEWVKEQGVRVVQMPEEEVVKMQEALTPVYEWYADESKECGRLVSILKEKGILNLQ